MKPTKTVDRAKALREIHQERLRRENALEQLRAERKAAMDKVRIFEQEDEEDQTPIAAASDEDENDLDTSSIPTRDLGEYRAADID